MFSLVPSIVVASVYTAPSLSPSQYELALDSLSRAIQDQLAGEIERPVVVVGWAR